MSNLFRKCGFVKRVVLDPLYILYYFHHANYIRMGRTERYASGWAPISAVSLFFGLFIWFIAPVDFIFNLLISSESGEFLKKFISGKEFFMAISICIYISMVIFLRKRRHEIISKFHYVKVPALPLLILILLLYAMPFMVISIALSRDHFFVSTALIVLYYVIFYMIYFQRLIESENKEIAKVKN